MSGYEQSVLNARKNFLKLNKSQEKELLNLYQELAKQLQSDIASCRTTSQESYLNNLHQIVELNIKDLNGELNKIVKANIETSSQIASATELEYYQSITDDVSLSAAFKGTVVNTSHETVKKLIQGQFYKNKTSLDQRLWNITDKSVKDIDTLIKVNVLRGANAKELAKQVEKYVNPLKKIEFKNDEVGFSKKVSYQASRLSRTSITHSFRETQIQQAMNNPFNMGMKWELSPSHGVRMHGKSDICDDYANQNNYELGSGVFPTDKMPIGHPQCLCVTYQVNTNIRSAMEELKAWTNGESNEKLDKWYEDNKKYSKQRNIKDETTKKTNTKAGKSDIIKSNKLIETENRLKRLDVTRYTSRKQLGRDILDSLDLNNIPVSVRKISANGFCSFSNSDTMDITEYVLNSNDYRNNNYKIKTALHEAFHAKSHGMKIDYFNIKKEWVHVEETLTESAAHYMVKQLGINQEIAPAYSDKLVDMLPRLKQLDKFKDCTKISDFGRIAWEDRLNRVEPMWAELYDESMKIKHDWKEYSKQYFEYISDNTEDLINKMLENMPKVVDYKEQMIEECNSAMKSINERKKLEGNEPMILRNVLIITMNRLGVK